MLVYIGDHKRAETRIADRDAQLDLAGKIARIGSFTYDHATQKLQLSRGCAAIYGLPETRSRFHAKFGARSCIRTICGG